MEHSSLTPALASMDSTFTTFSDTPANRLQARCMYCSVLCAESESAAVHSVHVTLT